MWVILMGILLGIKQLQTFFFFSIVSLLKVLSVINFNKIILGMKITYNLKKNLLNIQL